jgi:hypothetical protein
MPCRNCGYETPPEAVICANCGAPLPGPPRQPSLDQVETEMAGLGGVLHELPAAPAPPVTRSGAGRTIGVLVFLLVLAIVAGLVGYEVIAIQQSQQRSRARNAITQQQPVQSPVQVGQTDVETGGAEPDVVTTTQTAPVPIVGPDVSTPAKTVRAWYGAVQAKDYTTLDAVVVPDITRNANGYALSAPWISNWSIVSIDTSGTEATVQVDQTTDARSVARFTVVRQRDGRWLIATFK